MHWSLLLLPAIVFAQIPNKDLAAKRVVDLSVKILDKTKANNVFTCVQDDFYKQTPLVQLGATAAGCATSNVNMVSLAAMLPKLETCMITSLTSTMIVSGQVGPIVMNEIVTPLYDQVMDVVKQMKKNKKTKNQILNKVYGELLKNVTRPFVNAACLKVKAKLSDKAFKCLVENGKAVIDMTAYKCAESLKANILG